MTSRLRTLTCALLIVTQIPFCIEGVAFAQTGRRPRPQSNETKKGLQLKLSEGVPVEQQSASVPAAAAIKLSDGETQSVLKRLRPIKTEADDQQDFVMRDRSLPPPRTGKTIDTSFPPSEIVAPPERVETGPLEVLRYSRRPRYTTNAGAAPQRARRTTFRFSLVRKVLMY